MKIRYFASWAVGLAMLAGPAPASGAVTIGSDLAATDFFDSGPCDQPGGCGGIQQGIAGRVTAAPFDGVIVRWRGRGLGLTSLQVARYTGEDTAILVGASTPVNMSSLSVAGVFATRLPVAAGDYLGIRHAENAEFSIRLNDDADLDAFDAGLSATPFTSPDPDIPAEAALNADIEPDADRDGYGDETQDGCPALSSVQGQCPPPPSPPPEDADAPSFTAKLRARPSAFALGSRGTLISFRLSEAATVRFVVLRRRPARVAAASRYVRVGFFRRKGEAGTNRLRWRGRVRHRRARPGRVRHRRARPGRYRIVVTARDAAGNRSEAARTTVRVLSPGRASPGGRRS